MTAQITGHPDPAPPVPPPVFPLRPALAFLGICLGVLLFLGACTTDNYGGNTGNFVCTLFCEKYDYPAPLPAHSAQWLTKTNSAANPGLSADQIGHDYYAAIDPNNTKDTFAKWKQANGFDAGDEVVTYYYNAGDLDFGREMHCRQKTEVGIVASVSTYCYVTNYLGAANNPNDAAAGIVSPPLPGDLSAAEQLVKTALDRAVAHDPSQAFATVAMESKWVQGASNVTFFAFAQPTGSRVNVAILDSEGKKPVPVMCMTCHGGSYDYTTHLVTNASFLPFDLQSFRFSTTNGFTRVDQEDKFRMQNLMVKSSLTASAGIVRTINLLYPRGVQTPGLAALNDQIPPGWQGQGHDDVYLYVVRPYCRSCHQAQTPYASQYEWSTYQQFADAAGLIGGDVCGSHVMPHAEVPFFKFWQLDALQRGPEPLQKWLAGLNPPSTCAIPTASPSPTH